jgi:hypothetical protein
VIVAGSAGSVVLELMDGDAQWGLDGIEGHSRENKSPGANGHVGCSMTLRSAKRWLKV